MSDLGHRPAGSPPVWVDHVEWLPSDAETGLLRVRGRFGGPAPPTGQPALVALSAGGRRALEPLPERLVPEAPTWRAAFVAPASLLAPAPERLWLEWPGGVRAAVPVPAGVQPPPTPPAAPPTPGGELIDKAVLAERRARRAEAAERQQGRIAAEALKAVEALELRAREVEQRLEAALRERDVLAARVRHLEDELAAPPPAPEPEPQDEGPGRLAGALETVARLRAEVTRLRLALRVSETGRAEAAVRLVAGTVSVDAAGPAADELEARLHGTERRARELAAELTTTRAELAATRIAAAAGAVAQARAAALEREQAEATAAAPVAAPAPAPEPAPAAPAPPSLSESARRLAGPAAELPVSPHADALARDLEAAAQRLKRDPPPPAAPPPVAAASPAPPAAPASPRRTWSVAPLRLALIELARQDPHSAARLLVGLLPAQTAVVAGPLSYDLTLRELGTFAITIEEAHARVQSIGAPRRLGHAAFHLTADALTLAELLAGARRHRVGRHLGRVRASGKRRLLRVLEAVPAAAPTLPDAVRAGARVEPLPALRLLPHLVRPGWTRGHAFSVAFRIGEEAALVTAAEGRPLLVTNGGGADATVTMSPTAWERLLRGELQRAGDPVRVTGDARAAGRLGEWALRAGVPLGTRPTLRAAGADG